MLPILVLPPSDAGTENVIVKPRRLRLPVFALNPVLNECSSPQHNKSNSLVLKQPTLQVDHSNAIRKYNSQGNATGGNNAILSSTKSKNHKHVGCISSGGQRHHQQSLEATVENKYRVYKNLLDFLDDLRCCSLNLKKSEISFMEKYIKVNLRDIEKLEMDINQLCKHEFSKNWKKSKEIFETLSSLDGNTQNQHDDNVSLFMKVKPVLKKERNSVELEMNSMTVESTNTLSNVELAEFAHATALSKNEELNNLMQCHNQSQESMHLYNALVATTETINYRKKPPASEKKQLKFSSSVDFDAYKTASVGVRSVQRTQSNVGPGSYLVGGLGSRMATAGASIIGMNNSSTSALNSPALFSTSDGFSNANTLDLSSFSLNRHSDLNVTSGTSGSFMNVMGEHCSSRSIIDSVLKENTVNGKGKGQKSRKGVSHKISYKKQKAISDINDAASLRMELIKSLSSMQTYSNGIKDGILSVTQSLPMVDPKMKAFVLNVAAEKMSDVLHRTLVIKDLVRGWNAWHSMIAQDKQLDILRKYIKFQGYRYFSQYLDKKVGRLLRGKFQLWMDYTIAEKNRIRKSMELAGAQNIQRYYRGYLGRLKATAVRERQQYQAMYESTIILQKIFRGKIHRWRYLRHLRKKLELKSIRTLQRVARGMFGRKKCRSLRQMALEHRSIVKIQARARGYLVRRKVAEMHAEHLKLLSVLLIQALVRGFITRMSFAKKALLFRQNAAATKIQARIRGYICRSNIDRKRAQMAAYRAHIYKSATQIQAAYRGYRARILYKMLLISANRQKRIDNKAATAIITMVRGFLARRLLGRLKKEQYQKWLDDARNVKEYWSEDSECWFYLNSTTGDAEWTPPASGYTKNDGWLVLANGAMLEDPQDEAEEAAEEEDEEKRRMRYCVECSDRIAIRACNECGDRFCTKCYKNTHAIGSRRAHTWEHIGPLDCTECEMEVAERWCVACDEAFCDGCWRKVHGHGNRRYHPFSEIAADGSINPSITTMEGEDVTEYEPTFSVQKGLEVDAANAEQFEYDNNNASAYYAADDGVSTMEGSYDSLGQTDGGYYDENGEYIAAAPAAEGSEWITAYDDDGNMYYYNNFTGVSQYEDPNEGAYQGAYE